MLVPKSNKNLLFGYAHPPPSSPLTCWYGLQSHTEVVIPPVTLVTAHHGLIPSSVAAKMATLAVQALPPTPTQQDESLLVQVVAGRVDWMRKMERWLVVIKLSPDGPSDRIALLTFPRPKCFRENTRIFSLVPRPSSTQK